ncbi:hypothetical protein ABZX90_19910 [Streptomyces sp. NPDC002935]|uniref:hypothetical protein n=1 Tax=unclassified Streptomyces TaxID=2593676 RepID=UPI003317074C
MSMAKSTAMPVISRGLPAVVVGVFSLAWPRVTVRAIVVASARYALVAAGVMRDFSSERVGPVKVNVAGTWSQVHISWQEHMDPDRKKREERKAERDVRRPQKAADDARDTPAQRAAPIVGDACAGVAASGVTDAGWPVSCMRESGSRPRSARPPVGMLPDGGRLVHGCDAAAAVSACGAARVIETLGVARRLLMTSSLWGEARSARRRRVRRPLKLLPALGVRRANEASADAFHRRPAER